MNRPDITEQLKGIKAFYAKVTPSMLQQPDLIIEPATEEELAEFEQELGFALPDYYREFLLKNDYAVLLRGNYRLMTLSQIRYRCAMMKDLVENKNYNDAAATEKYESNWYGREIKPMLWNTAWLPFALDSGGNMRCIDPDPDVEGIRGQIIGTDVSEGPYLQGSISLGHFLKRHLTALEEGDYDLVDEGDGHVFVYMR